MCYPTEREKARDRLTMRESLRIGIGIIGVVMKCLDLGSMKNQAIFECTVMLTIIKPSTHDQFIYHYITPL